MLRVPTEFDIELQYERGRWLRRRLLWLCAVSIALTLLAYLRSIYTHLSMPSQQVVGWAELAECVIVVGLYMTAWSYARQTEMEERPLLQLVFWLVIIVATVELISERLNISLALARGGQDARMPVALISTGVGLVVLTFDHLLACVFMPWTAREALRPARFLLGMYAIPVIFDIATAELPGVVIVAIPVMAICLTPGILICVWRNSRFRQNFRLRFESSRYRQLQNELASARRLHEASLPKEKTDGPIRLHYAYEPMRQIGGDLLFLHTLEATPHLASVVVLDVTGHGIAAAITVNRLIGELERLFAERPDTDPDVLLRGLNRYVALTLATHDIYATAFCAKVNAETGDVVWASAGHPPAVVHRVDGTQELLGATAPILGVDDGEQFFDPPGKLQLNAADVILAYTDGVCEAVDPKGEQLGIAGVQKLIVDFCAGQCDADAWPNRMLERVLNYRQSPVEDDTLLVTLFASRKGG